MGPTESKIHIRVRSNDIINEANPTDKYNSPFRRRADKKSFSDSEIANKVVRDNKPSFSSPITNREMDGE